MNAPDIAPAVRAEAARGLLERLYEKTALIRFFRYNAAAKHGVPIKDREFEIRVPEPPKEVIKEVPVEKEVIKEVPVAGETQRAALEPARDDPWRWTKNALGALAVVGATAAGTAGLMSLAGGGGSKDGGTPSPQSVTKYKQSPLQFIEDQGAHIP